MDFLTIRCRSCFRHLKLPESELGKDVKCPACQTIFKTGPEDLVTTAAPAGITSRRLPEPSPPQDEGPAPPGEDERRAREDERRFGGEDDRRSRDRRSSDDDDDDRRPRDDDWRSSRRRRDLDDDDDTYFRRQRRLDQAIQSVSGPAIALIVMGIADLLVAMGCLFLAAIPSEDPEARKFQAALLVIGMITTCWGGLMLTGAIMMKLMRSYPFAMLASILSLVPVPCCILNIALGIWALVVLSDPEVQRAFEWHGPHARRR